jgi:hypothetical protein
MVNKNNIVRENELKQRVWESLMLKSLVDYYGEENVLEVEPFVYCVPELDCEGNERVLRIRLETPRKNAQGEEYDMYEAADIYKAEMDKKRADKEASEAKKRAEQEAKEKRKENKAKARQASAKKIRKDAAKIEAENETEPTKQEGE